MVVERRGCLTPPHCLMGESLGCSALERLLSNQRPDTCTSRQHPCKFNVHTAPQVRASLLRWYLKPGWEQNPFEFRCDSLRCQRRCEPRPTPGFCASPALPLALQCTLNESIGVRWAGEQVSLLMDMFQSQFAPRMDFVGQVENLDDDYEMLHDVFSHSQQGRHPSVRAFMQGVAKVRYVYESSQERRRRFKSFQAWDNDSRRHDSSLHFAWHDDTIGPATVQAHAMAAPATEQGLRANAYRTKVWSTASHIDDSTSQLDAVLLCRVAQRLRFEYQCLAPLYDIRRWCPQGVPAGGD
jgi:hypothetical protein